ncbi:MAG: CRISPR-associated protein Cas5, partial [Thermosphaera sp.]
MKSYSIILTELFFSWGHFIKPPYLSLGGYSLPYPPPTTLIGALAYPYFKYHGSNKEIEYNRGYYYSPTIKLLEYVKYASLGYLNPRVTQITDINKYFTFAYIGDEHRK